MNTTRTASVGSSNVVHTAHLIGESYSITCGAVRYRSTSRSSLHIYREGTAEVTCTKCLKAAAEAAPAAPVLLPYYGKPINTPTGHKWMGDKAP